MAEMRAFGDGLVAVASTVEQPDKWLEMDENGLLELGGRIPSGFHLAVGVPKENRRTFITQKQVGVDLGGYQDKFLVKVGASKDVQFTVMNDPIQVQRAGHDVWTVWHPKSPEQTANRVDCYTIGRDGMLVLDQAGVIARCVNDEYEFRLHAEPRYHGKLFTKNGELVVRPDDPGVRWGPFVTWKKIFDHPEFRRLVKSAKIAKWTGKPQELEPGFPRIPDGDFAVCQWFIPFAGQDGFGYVWLNNSCTKAAAIHGCDLLVEPDSDGVKRVHRGDVLRYRGTDTFGSKRSVCLCNVEVYSRSW